MDKAMYLYLLNYFDLPILHAINGYCGKNWVLDRLVSHVALDFKWAIPLCVFWGVVVQIERGSSRKQKVLFAGVFAVLLSLAINRSISVMMTYRVRPMETPGIDYHKPPFAQGFNSADFELWSSFPSDQATYFFAFATLFWYFSVPLALAMFAYSTIIVLCRVYLGTHFPSDVLVGALIGIAVQLALNREAARAATMPFVAFAKSKPDYFSAFLFLSCSKWAQVL